MAHKLGWLMLVIMGVLLAGCGRAEFTGTPTLQASTATRPAPTPTPAATWTATPTLTLTPTAVPSPTSTLEPTPTPSALATGQFFFRLPEGVPNYTLKTLDDAALWDIISAESPTLPKDQDGDSYDGYYMWPVARVTLLRELLARYPNSPHAAEARALLADPENYPWDTLPVEPFRAVFEAALNANPGVLITRDGLEVFLSKQFPDGFWLVGECLLADNLLGDGKPGWALEIFSGGAAGFGAALALTGEPGAYRLTATRPEWTRFMWSGQKVFTYDLNANGISEIAVWESYWGMGMSHGCREAFYLYEWDGSGFVNLTPGLTTAANTDAGDCLGFETQPGPNGTQAITTGYVIFSGCKVNDVWQAGSLQVQRRYEWNGTRFALAGEEALPLEASMPEGAAAINPCTLSWVNEAGPANDQAYALLPQLLAETDPDLVAGFSEQFGPAYLDFFRFKLGTWHALRGRQAQALALLTQVRDQPANPDYTTAAQLAAAFLQSYPSVSAYAGCAAANPLLDINEFTYESDPLSLNTAAMREAWGFSDEQWSYGGGNLFSGPSGRSDPLNLCSLEAAFQLAIQKQAFTGRAALTGWLERQGLPYTGLVETDVDGDGRSDWLLLAGTGPDQDWQLWAVLNQGGASRPLRVQNLDRATGQVPAAWGRFTPNAKVGALHVYQWPDGMAIFRVVSRGGWMGVEKLYTAGDTFLGFTVRPAADGAETLEALIVGEDAWDTDWYVLGWAPDANALQVISSPQVDRDQEIQTVERLIFEQGDPAAALETLKAMLDLWHGVVDAYSGGLPTVKPYLRYLQGLAYELSGDKINAVAAYWTLWHDYPVHPLSYVVQLKLEMVKP